MKPLYVGNDVYIDSNTIFCIMSSWHPKAKKFIAQAKKENNFLDFTAGKGEYLLSFLILVVLLLQYGHQRILLTI